MARGIAMRQREPVPVPPAHAMINTSAPLGVGTGADNSRVAQANNYDEQEGLGATGAPQIPASIQRLQQFAETNGDISHLLDPGVVAELGIKAVREWTIDDGSRQSWKEQAQRSLNIAAQEDPENDDEGEFTGAGEGLWENSADIHYPLLTTASQQFAARAGPELVKGDEVVSVKVFAPPQKKPSPGQIAQNAPHPPTQQGALQTAQGLHNETQADNADQLQDDARQARADRVKQFLNWLIFYQMDDWEGETDLLLHQIPITGSAFKKVYMGTTGLCSDYISALRLTVHNDTKSIYRCPRITEEFEVYPYEITERQRAGIYREGVELPVIGEDPEAQRKFIEQHRMDDLDGDGMAEPYVVTVDIETKTTMRIEPAYTTDDIKTLAALDPVSGQLVPTKVTNIERWGAYAAYLFLPDPRGKFYGIGFGRLLDSITDSVDTTINQLLDAGTAEIAGGGFIGSNVRLQGSGQGGSVFFRPGEYQTVGTVGTELRAAIWERTVPHPSEVSFKLLEFLLAAAKDIASVKDVDTGNTPTTAPVGTTLAVQAQALQVFSAIYKRIYRGFRDEFRLMYKTLRRYGGDREIAQYRELTGGDFRTDFSGDGTDIQPVADPAVVTRMLKIARLQTVSQIAESPLGAAAGMTQPKQAQEIVGDMLRVLDVSRPDRYVGPVAPNPLEQAKAADLAAAAQLKGADAQLRGVQAHRDTITSAVDAHKGTAEATLTHARTLRELGMAAKDTASLHQEADRVARTGTVATAEQLVDPTAEAARDRQVQQTPEGPRPNGA